MRFVPLNRCSFHFNFLFKFEWRFNDPMMKSRKGDFLESEAKRWKAWTGRDKSEIEEINFHIFFLLELRFPLQLINIKREKNCSLFFLDPSLLNWHDKKDSNLNRYKYEFRNIEKWRKKKKKIENEGKTKKKRIENAVVRRVQVRNAGFLKCLYQINPMVSLCTTNFIRKPDNNPKSNTKNSPNFFYTKKNTSSLIRCSNARRKGIIRETPKIL